MLMATVFEYTPGLCRATFNMLPESKIEATKKDLAENKANNMM